MAKRRWFTTCAPRSRERLRLLVIAALAAGCGADQAATAPDRATAIGAIQRPLLDVEEPPPGTQLDEPAPGTWVLVPIAKAGFDRNSSPNGPLPDAFAWSVESHVHGAVGWVSARGTVTVRGTRIRTR